MSENQDFTALSGSNVEIEAFGVPGTTGHFAAPLAHPPAVRMAHEAFWIASPPRDKDLHVGFVATFGWLGMAKCDCVSLLPPPTAS